MTMIIIDIIILLLMIAFIAINFIIGTMTTAIALAIASILFLALTIVLEICDNKKKTRGFELISEENKKNKNIDIKLPFRATKNSMAYDFYAPIDYTVKPHEIVKIWTDVKTYMQSNEGLVINVRSSMGGRFQLANTQGWIDSDYYNNENNEGNIGIFLLNMTNDVQYIKQGEAIAQGMFITYLKSDNGNGNNIRIGGFGSTNK